MQVPGKPLSKRSQCTYAMRHIVAELAQHQTAVCRRTESLSRRKLLCVFSVNVTSDIQHGCNPKVAAKRTCCLQLVRGGQQDAGDVLRGSDGQQAQGCPCGWLPLLRLPVLTAGQAHWVCQERECIFIHSTIRFCLAC